MARDLKIFQKLTIFFDFAGYTIQLFVSILWRLQAGRFDFSS
jgi:hypothetical protein